MASLGHVAVGLAGGRASERGRAPSWPAILGWSALSLLPDIDVVGFMRGVPYGAEWGHRGATHSLTLAVAGGIAVGLAARWFKRPIARTTAFAIVVLASHGLLDTMTDGGLGVALLWPFSLARYFAPWRPIPVAPIGPAFFTPEGATIALTEFVLFLPVWLYAFRIRQRAVVVALWLAAGWLLTSTDPVHERMMTFMLPDDTRFAAGYSEAAFRAIDVGDEENAVRARLGEPLNESLYYMPKGSPFKSMMEVSPTHLQPGCFGALLRGGVVEETLIPEQCRARGVVEGLSKADVLRILGTPSESCAAYSESPTRGRVRLRTVCFLGGKVEVVFRRRA